MKVYIGTPTASMIHSFTCLSLMALQTALFEKGYDSIVDMSIANVVPFIRNKMCKRAMEYNCDVILFVDSDMSFDPPDVMRLLESDHEVCALPYRYKKTEEEYNCQIVSDANMMPVVVDGWLELTKAGTGIFAVKRSALVKMMEWYGDRTYATKDGEEIISLFECELFEGKNYTADYNFCRRWVLHGGKIWMWPDAYVGHHGIASYNGNLADYLVRQNDKRPQAMSV